MVACSDSCSCTPKCPRCHSTHHVRESGNNHHVFYCGKCGREFEDVDDGEVGYGRPDRRLIRKENGLQKQQGKRPNHARH